MAQKSVRALRVGDEIKKILGSFIQRELRHPALEVATVVEVSLSNDLRYAKVFISIMGDKQVKDDGMAIIQKNRGLLKRELSRKLYIKALPDLNFFLDETLDNAMRIEELLNQIKKDDERPEHD